MLIREKLTFLHTINIQHASTADVWPLLPPEWQFGARTTSFNTALGRLTRHLDTTNGDERGVLFGLQRITSELRSVGYSSGTINKAVKQLSRSATLDVTPVLKFDEGNVETSKL